MFNLNYFKKQHIDYNLAKQSKEEEGDPGLMKHLIKVSEHYVNVILNGKLYAHEAGLLRDELVEEIERGATEVRIDLSDVSYIDSSGLGVLITVHKMMKEKNGTSVLTGVQGMVGELLRRTRLNKVLTIE